jgi:hypothetical protein
MFGQLAWDLGNGFGFSYALGSHFDVDQPVAFSSTSLNQRFALSYTAHSWELTPNVIYGTQLDLTATKKFGKWESSGLWPTALQTSLPRQRAIRNKASSPPRWDLRL